jgi:hypothetical protein
MTEIVRPRIGMVVGVKIIAATIGNGHNLKLVLMPISAVDVSLDP